jgi:hypothetical protein
MKFIPKIKSADNFFGRSVGKKEVTYEEERLEHSSRFLVS